MLFFVSSFLANSAFLVSKQVQQYYHHSYYPTPPMLQCSKLVSAYFADYVAMQQWCGAAYEAMLHQYSATQIQGKNHAMLQHNIGAKVWDGLWLSLRVFSNANDAMQ